MKKYRTFVYPKHQVKTNKKYLIGSDGALSSLKSELNSNQVLCIAMSVEKSFLFNLDLVLSQIASPNLKDMLQLYCSKARFLSAA